MGTIDLRSSFLKGSARWQLICQNAQLYIHIIQFSSIGNLISPSHSIAHRTFRVDLDSVPEEMEGARLGFICSFLVLSCRVGSGNGHVNKSWLPRYNISDTCVTTAHSSRPWTARLFYLTWWGCKEITRMVLICSWPLETNSTYRTGDFHDLFFIYIYI